MELGALTARKQVFLIERALCILCRIRSNADGNFLIDKQITNLPKYAALTRLILPALLLTACAANTDYPPFWWTPQDRVTDMLEIAEVTEDDVVYDLGSGDGRIVIAAAQKFGARGVGVEIDPDLVEQSNNAAAEAGVSDRVRFVRGDFYETDFSAATVVTMYLFEETNAKLKPYLMEQLAPDARIVTYKYRMPGWTPVKTNKRVYLYALPEN